jgi:hypothetical protein
MDALIYSGGAAHQEQHAQAMRAGLARHGIRARIERPGNALTADFAVCWGWRIGQRLRELGRPVLVMERGYLGDRFAWTSLGWNGLNGHATFRAPDDGGARFRAHHAAQLQAWRGAAGQFVLLLGQVPGDASLRGLDLSAWYADQAQRARAATGLPVRFRKHPVAAARGYVQRVPGADAIGGELQHALGSAAWAVTFNSNAAVDAVLAGVPTVATDAGSMAWPVTQRAIGDASEPDRAAWLSRLAWCQWTAAEIASGEAWATVGAQLECTA